MDKDINFVFKMLNKKKLFFSLSVLLFLDCLYMFVPFSFTIFLTLPFTLNKAIIICIIFILSKLLRIFLLYIWRLYTDKYIYAYSREQLLTYYNKIEKIPSKNLNNYQTGYLQNIINNILAITKSLLTQDYFYIILGLILFYYTVFTQSIFIGTLCLGLGVICILVSIFTLKRANKSLGILYEEENKYNANYQDIISNLRTVKVLGNSSFFADKIKQSGNQCLSKAYNYIRYYSLEEFLRNTLIFIPFVLAMVKAVYDMSLGIDTLGIITFYIYQNAEMGSVFSGMSRNLIDWFKLNVLKKQAWEVIKDCKKASYIYDFETFTINNANIKYDESAALIQIPEFICNKNDKICIYGKSGEGKTSLLNLIIGNVDHYSGEILVDNLPKDGKLLDAGFVSQEIELFNTTLRENLCMGKNISSKQLEEYLVELDLLEFIKLLDKGLDTEVGEKGLKLSTGQKRRINLLRSYLMNKDIYILDEPTSNLDKNTEKLVCNFIMDHFLDKTLIISTHNDEIKKICNKFYKMENHILNQKTEKVNYM